ncbi:MAG TPA: four helix bundle protein, partial [Gemmatimonadaceae bacterium]|nr:four helix bundle protein [Gemmatimonadaceae bacterium]
MNQAERDERLETWSRSQPLDITEDPIWRLDCYREAAYLFALARDDALVLRDDRPFGAVGEQLLRCAGSIAANVAEAYGRPTSGD